VKDVGGRQPHQWLWMWNRVNGGEREGGGRATSTSTSATTVVGRRKCGDSLRQNSVTTWTLDSRWELKVLCR